MKYNYHTHTKRCNHANGSDEQYIESAIKANYQGLGFSDHVMLPFVTGSYIRADYDVKDEYLSTMKELKEKYKDQIELYVGFECEWDNKYQKYYRSLLDNKEVDYLIFGNHACYFKKNKEYPLKIKSPKSYLQRYLKVTIKALRSGLFKVMAHPDVFMSHIKWSSYAKKVSTIICKEAKANDVVLELNCGCFVNEKPRVIHDETRYRYPYNKFWQIARKYQNKIIVGVDAHSPSAFHSNGLQIMEEFIKKHKLNVLEKIDL